MKYQHYTLEDFLMDADFRKWVLEPETSTSAFWESWIQENPEKRPIIEEAKSIILTVEKDEIDFPEEKREILWQGVSSVMEENPSRNVRPMFEQFYGHWQKIAAVFAGLLLISVAYFLIIQNDTQEYTTAFGETRQIRLPDNSLVTLNANSTLTIAADWNGKNARTVSLHGEAFFDITHTPDDQKFIVHTDGLDVMVLGTTFNVNHRDSQTAVVLTTGSIQLNTQMDTLLMQPGELIEFDEHTSKLVKRIVNTEKYIAWKDNLLVFQDTPLREIARILEDNYNYKVVFEDPQIANEKFIGTFPADKIHVLLRTLEKSMPLEVDGQILTFRKQ